MLMNEAEFCKKIVLLVKPGTSWVMCYMGVFVCAYVCVCVCVCVRVYQPPPQQTECDTSHFLNGV